MGFVLLIDFLEEDFGIKASDEDLIEENFESVTAISNYILRKRAAKAA
jgi:acyl carrier protein